MGRSAIKRVRPRREQDERRAGRPPGGTGPRTRERILDEATALFSRSGEAGVGMREIAAAAGVNVATVHHHFGGKKELYEAVFARMYAKEAAVVGAAAERIRARVASDPGALASGLHELLDVYLDHLDEHPEVTFLWLRRWLDPDGHARFDEEYSLPLYRLVEELLGEPTPHAAARSIVWAVHGHVTAAREATSDLERRQFRAFIHHLLDQLWGPGS